MLVGDAGNKGTRTVWAIQQKFPNCRTDTSHECSAFGTSPVPVRVILRATCTDAQGVAQGVSIVAYLSN